MSIVIIQQQEEDNRERDKQFRNMMNNVSNRVALTNSNPAKSQKPNLSEYQPRLLEQSNDEPTRKITPKSSLSHKEGS